MYKQPKLTPVISITAASSNSLRSIINRNTRIKGAVMVIRPQRPAQYSIEPNGPDAA